MTLDELSERVGWQVWRGLLQEDGYALDGSRIRELGLDKEIGRLVEVVARDYLYDVSWLRFIPAVRTVVPTEQLTREQMLEVLAQHR